MTDEFMPVASGVWVGVNALASLLSSETAWSVEELSDLAEPPPHGGGPPDFHNGPCARADRHPSDPSRVDDMGRVRVPHGSRDLARDSGR